MSNFRNRWQKLASEARRASPPSADIPPGFASRVLARARQNPDDSLEWLWLRQSRQALGWATALLAICAALNYSGRQAPEGIRPPIETAVAAVISGL